MKYKLIVSDIDGVCTDGSFYYSPEGDVLRKFNTKDSYGVKLSQLMGIPILVISTEDNEMVKKRMEKLHVQFVKLGINAGIACTNAYFTKYSQSYPLFLWIRKYPHFN